jgi:hypothetical protein
MPGRRPLEFAPRMLGLSVGVRFDSSRMRRNGNEVGLLFIVIGQFKASSTTLAWTIAAISPGLAEPLPSGLAHADDTSELGISEIGVRDSAVSPCRRP